MELSSVLFVCIENSCRSQMAEGFAKAHGQGIVDARSAGSKPSGKVNPRAIQFMKEKGIDLDSAQSKGLDQLPLQWDYVITMGCGDACPALQTKIREDWGLPDPKNLPDQEFRIVRDQIEKNVINLMSRIKENDMTNPSNEELKDAVRKRYASIAIQDEQSGCCESEKTCGGSSSESCCSGSEDLGYSIEDLRSMPEGADLGLGCGNPQAIANLKPGETVLDLGSGAGIDCFLSAKRVGAGGHVIGVDMTHEMLAKARSNAQKGGFSNTEFRLGEIEYLPVADNTVDVVISNCVINLSIDKFQVFKEAYRVLKKGGRVAVSDVVATAVLPGQVKKDLALYAGCMAGALQINELEDIMQRAGFVDIRIEPKAASKKFIREWAPGRRVEDYIVSANIMALKS